jgi:hypothetical protein
LLCCEQLGHSLFLVNIARPCLGVGIGRTPTYRWQGLMEFSENQPFLSSKNFAILRFFVRQKSGLWPKLIILSRPPIWHPEMAILSGNFIRPLTLSSSTSSQHSWCLIKYFIYYKCLFAALCSLPSLHPSFSTDRCPPADLGSFLTHLDSIMHEIFKRYPGGMFFRNTECCIIIRYVCCLSMHLNLFF